MLLTLTDPRRRVLTLTDPQHGVLSPDPNLNSNPNRLTGGEFFENWHKPVLLIDPYRSTAFNFVDVTDS